jgi:hypothetical protein
MNWLGQAIWGFIRGLLGHAQEQADRPHIITPAATPPEKLKAHQDQVRAFKTRKDQSRTIKVLWFAIVASLWHTGCATRSTITIDSQSDLIMILKPVRTSGAIYRNGHWEDAGKVEIPAGWVAGPEAK